MIYLYGYYIIIKGLEKLTRLERNTLNELLEGIMIKPNIKTEKDVLTAIDVVKSEMSWESFIVSVNGDFFANLKLYESVMFNSKTLLKESLKNNLNKNIFIDIYNNDKTLFYNYTNKYINESLRKQVFKSLYNDKEFLRSMKIYLESDKNTTLASKRANLHRNTLDNRLEKFTDITGYDLKNFDDSVFIYMLLKDLWYLCAFCTFKNVMYFYIIYTMLEL